MLPLVGAISNIQSESNFASFRSLWQTARKMWPNVWVTVAVPEHQFPKFDEVLTPEERTYLELMPEPDVLAQFHVQETQFDPTVINRFNRYNGTDWVELVITSRLMVGQQLLCGLGDWRGMAGSPVVGLYEPGVAQDRLPHNAITRPGMLMKVLSVAACPTQFLTQEEVDKLLAWARPVASPSMVYEIMRHSEIIQPVVGGVAEDPVAAPKEHVLFFGGRFSVGKNIPFLFDVYADAFALGHNVRIVATCPSVIKIQYRKLAEEKGKGPDGQPLIQLIRKCGREEFHRHASQATIGLIASFHEGYPSGFIEMAVKGQLTLFPDERWARDSLPADYPWFYKNRAEAHALIKRGLTWEWTSMVRRQLACLRPHHAHTDSTYHERRLQFWADPKWAEELSRPRRAPQEISDMLVDFAKDRETFTLEEACAGITERSRAISKASWDHPPARFWCRPGVHHELLQLGFEDICDGPTCRYRRVEEAVNGEEDSAPDSAESGLCV